MVAESQENKDWDLHGIFKIKTFQHRTAMPTVSETRKEKDLSFDIAISHTLVQSKLQ